MTARTSFVHADASEARRAFGHPSGLLYLAATEAWERFSFYGMVALLVLYLVKELLLPGHEDRVLGLAQLRSACEFVTGPLSQQAFASMIFGLYSGFVYFTPILGGAIADRWIGQRNAVVAGALLMTAGHFAMAFDGTFLLALLLLVIGSGFLKGNIAAQVGALYAPDEEARRARGFVIFTIGINVGAVIGPLVCGFLAQAVGWHYGFGLAGLFMLLGLATYLLGYRTLPAKVERRGSEAKQLTDAEKKAVVALIVIMGITVFQSIGYYQLFNVVPLWISRNVALRVAGFNIPVPWFQSVTSVFCLLGAPLLFWYWRNQRRRAREPHDIGKIVIGAGITAFSNLVLVIAIVSSGTNKINPIWVLVYCASLATSFLYYWPTLLALVSRVAPAQVNATLMGIVYLTLFVANLLVGRIGGFYERMQPVQFWTLHATIAASGGLLLAILSRRLDGLLRLPCLRSEVA